MVTTENDITEDGRDALTGLPSAAMAHSRLDAWVHAGQAQGQAGANIHAMLIGLKRFDTVNLAYGAAAGDTALVEVAARILRFAGDAFDTPWTVARIGGGNFLLAANDACSRERWQWLAEELAASIARPIANPGIDGTMRLWPRIALMRGLEGEGGGAIIDRLADTLERSRSEAGRRVSWVDGEITLAGRTARELEADLLGAIDRDEIEVLFQPQYAASDDSLVGAEALARWSHPGLGTVGAAALFAIAERADHVAQLSRHIATRALAAAAQWPEGLRLSLNVTPEDLASGSFANEISATVIDAGFSPSHLTLEITEQALLTDLDRSAREFAQLADLGIRIALDDFGAGFCNFRYLKLLPLDYLKLDRSMVEGICDDVRDMAVFRAIVAMAEALELAVIAEGIETEDQRACIASEGVTAYQGFLKAKPMSVEEFTALATG